MSVLFATAAEVVKEARINALLAASAKRRKAAHHCHQPHGRKLCC